MKLLVTGASGFLGRYIVKEALRKGHDVRAMVRPASKIPTVDAVARDRLEVVRADLRSRAGLVDAVRGVDCVIHAAAAKSGEFYGRFASTVIATENLLDAMEEAGVRRIAHISSFALYDYLGRWSYAVLDEDSPLEPKPARRHAYCETKLIQERLIQDFATQHGWWWTLLRPGAIYGREATWVSRLGLKGEKRWIRLGAWAPVPLSYVENCAEAVVLAAETEEAGSQVFNIVDDDPPTQRRYMAALRDRTTPRPRIIPVAWTLVRSAARGIWLVNQVFFRGRAKAPALLVPASAHASAKPLRYPNGKIKEVLGWRQRYTLEEALDRCFAPDEPATEDRGTGVKPTPEPSTAR